MTYESAVPDRGGLGARPPPHPPPPPQETVRALKNIWKNKTFFRALYDIVSIHGNA